MKFWTIKNDNGVVALSYTNGETYIPLFGEKVLAGLIIAEVIQLPGLYVEEMEIPSPTCEALFNGTDRLNFQVVIGLDYANECVLFKDLQAYFDDLNTN